MGGPSGGVGTSTVGWLTCGPTVNLATLAPTENRHKVFDCPALDWCVGFMWAFVFDPGYFTSYSVYDIKMKN